MTSAATRTTLPIIVDTPTPTPSLGFENYVSGISAAIMGGQPAQYTVGLYGPWGSGKSSLLAAIRRELRAWPHPPGEMSDGSSFEFAPEAPIVVDFDAWRYADKGSLLISILLRIKAAVQLRTEAIPDESAKQKNAKKALGIIVALIRNVEVSVLGVTVAANSLEAPAAEVPDLVTKFMPFEQLGDIGKALPPEQRIVVLVDDLDRCSPAGVVSIIEAIHVLTDITGIVFVLALDYEYLTSAILSAYPTADPDRFIEKIVQVPFHVPAPKIEAAVMADIIPTWSAISPWLAAVSEDDIGAIMRIGLRSNPRQIKRLFNTYLLFAYMNGVRPGVDSRRTSTLDNALALKVLGLQVAWPAAFAELLRELALEYTKSAVRSEPWEAVGELDSYASWHAGESIDGKGGLDNSQDRDEGDEEGDDEEGDAEVAGSGKGARSRQDKMESTRHYTQESLARLRTYLHEVLTHKTPPREIWRIMVMAHELTQSEKEQPDSVNVGTTIFQDTLANANQDVRDRYAEIVNFLSGLEENDSTEKPSYFRISRRANGKMRVFGQLRIRPTQESIRLSVGFGTADMADIEGQNFPNELYLDPRVKDGIVGGNYIIRDVGTSGVNEDVQRILRFAHAHVKP